MSRIDELIAELCPDGVEFKALGELGKRNKGTAITAARMKTIQQTDGQIRVFAGGQTVADVAEGSVPERDVVRVPSIIVKSRGHIGFTYYNRPFTHKAELWSYSISRDDVDQKFVYYYLLTQVEALQETARATSVKLPQLGVRDTDTLRIPVPPLEVQREIVRVLDTFTTLEAELEAELEARRRQYAHYRDRLLTFPEGGVRWIPMGEVVAIGTGSRNTNEAVAEGAYPFFVRSQEPLAIDEFEFDEAAVITAGDGVGVGKVFHFVDGKYALHQRAYRLCVQSDDLVPKFLYHFIRHDFARYLTRTAVHASVTSLRKPMFEAYPIPLPPLAEQARIVAILDKFDALVNDLGTGLPAELAARRKQYAHYRDKLLTFKEATA